MQGILEAAGGSLEDVVYNMIFLANMGGCQAMNEVCGSCFPENPLARAGVQAGPVKPGFPVEIGATAVIHNQPDGTPRSLSRHMTEGGQVGTAHGSRGYRRGSVRD